MKTPAVVVRRPFLRAPLAVGAIVLLLPAGCAAPREAASTPGSVGVGPSAVAAGSASAAVPTSSAAVGPAFGSAAMPMTVQVTGLVLADNKGTVVMCPPFPVAGVGTTSKEPPTPDCRHAIPTAGVDITKVGAPQHNSTHRWGEVHIIAAWNGAALAARSQRLPVEADQQHPERLGDHVACPAPTGGWKLGGVQDDPGIQQIQVAVGSGFGALAMGYPHGGPTNADGSNPSYSLDHTEQVVVVGVNGAIGPATTAIRKVFKGNLCVVRSATTAALVDRQDKQILDALGDDMTKIGVIDVAGTQDPLGTPGIAVDVVVDTPGLQKMLAGVPGPAIVVNAWITPVR